MSTQTPTLEELYANEPPKSDDTAGEAETPPEMPEEPSETPEAEGGQPEAESESEAKAESSEQGEETGEKDTDAPPASGDELPADVKGLQAALKAERVKRQELGTKVTDYEKQLADQVRRAEEYEALVKRLSHQQQQPNQQEARNGPQSQRRQEPPDPEMEPAAFAAWQQHQYAEALAQRDQAIVETRVVQSQEMMRQFKSDYDEAEEVFAEAAERDPSLWQKLYAHPFPAKFAYEEGKRLKIMREMGDDPEKYIQDRVAKALEEEMAKQQAETPPQPQVPTTPARQASPPQSLAQVPSAAPRSKPADTGPVPLEQLYSKG